MDRLTGYESFETVTAAVRLIFPLAPQYFTLQDSICNVLFLITQVSIAVSESMGRSELIKPSKMIVFKQGNKKCTNDRLSKLGQPEPVKRKCEGCNKAFSHQKNLNRHQKESCPGLVDLSSRGKLECEMCGRLVMSKSSLIRHKKKNCTTTRDFSGNMHAPISDDFYAIPATCDQWSLTRTIDMNRDVPEMDECVQYVDSPVEYYDWGNSTLTPLEASSPFLL